MNPHCDHILCHIVQLFIQDEASVVLFLFASTFVTLGCSRRAACCFVVVLLSPSLSLSPVLH